eukprot:SAG22_NODE_1048_length_5851_cov_33.333449_6_plen_69_part_00
MADPGVKDMTINPVGCISDPTKVMVKKKVTVDKRVFAGCVAAVVLLPQLVSIIYYGSLDSLWSTTILS